ncbi:hypothetical protein JST97_35855 [bacterium]|nr:hypothetical protein [bacterium]
MVKRWKDEMILGLTLFVCAIFGGYFGGKLAQMRVPNPHETFNSTATFGQLPAEAKPTFILIVVHDSGDGQPESASNRYENPLNGIQARVNII